MSQLRFLFDEDIDPDLINALVKQEPAIDVSRVTWRDAPPSGTTDPDLLLSAESTGRLLVSKDKKSMPDHLAAHFAAGHHTHGVALVRGRPAFAVLVESLLILWTATEAEDWVDGMVYLPL